MKKMGTKSNRKRYVINFEKFFEMITKRNQNEKNNDSTITEIWQPDPTNNELKLMNKEMVDNKYDTNNNLCNLRYEFINNLINQVLSVYATPDGEIINDEEMLSFGQKIIFESFLKEGVIYESPTRSSANFSGGVNCERLKSS